MLDIYNTWLFIQGVCKLYIDEENEKRIWHGEIPHMSVLCQLSLISVWTSSLSLVARDFDCNFSSPICCSLASLSSARSLAFIDSIDDAEAI